MPVSSEARADVSRVSSVSAAASVATPGPRDDRSLVASAVAAGLKGSHKTLPSWMLYDEEGSRLFEEITLLPEYYPCRAEQSILEERASEIIDAVAGDAPRLSVAELGAGTATKSQILLRAVVERQGSVRFLPTDVSASALAIATERVAFVPGSAFFATDAKKNTIRLNFSSPNEAQINEGIKRLARLLGKM